MQQPLWGNSHLVLGFYDTNLIGYWRAISDFCIVTHGGARPRGSET